MKLIIFLLFILLTSMPLIAQNSDHYFVSSQLLNMREGPGTEHVIIFKLSQDDVVTLIKKNTNGWWLVDYAGTKGYVHSQYLQISQIDPYDGWSETNYQSGITPDCQNVNPEYDYTIDNYLKVNVGSKTDVVIKLMKINNYGEDVCIRIVYVRSGEAYSIKNIPEGKYYLKIAYGKDYRQKVVNNCCYVKFMKNALYEKGTEILDFYKIKKPDQRIGDSIYENWNIPSFELFLDIIVSNLEEDTFPSNEINEAEFNK